MSAGTPGVAVAAPSTEEKVLAAAQQASAIVAMFQPQAAAAIQAGVEVEPIIKGLVGMFIAIFQHHASK